MSGNTFGKLFCVTSFGESHGPAIGCVIDGCPPGLLLEAAHIQREVSRQLEELGERTREAVSTATQKVIAEFDRFGESLLGKETYWQTASGRRAVTRPDADVLPSSIPPGDSKPEG